MMSAKDQLRQLLNQKVATGSLASKWMPRKGPLAAKLRNALRMSPKTYRKLLVNLTKVVETQMCANEWDKVNYEQVPSLAQIRYKTAFARHDTDRYLEYVAAVEAGEKKVNAAAVYPHDIVKNLGPLSDAQWKALPNYMEGAKERILPVCDVSGSMYGLPMHVSVSLGLYISERNEGAFKDIVCTFSAKPELIKLKAKRLTDRVQELENIEWGFNTDIEAVFRVMLDQAKKHRVPESEMPTTILIISDMEFDVAVKSGGRDHNPKAIEVFRQYYERAGYQLPKVVFWNVNGRVGNVPVTADDRNVALVSGFSPSILQGILSADTEQFTPRSVMLSTVMVDRYDWKK
jgi:hypothetical protein